MNLKEHKLSKWLSSTSKMSICHWWERIWDQLGSTNGKYGTKVSIYFSCALQGRSLILEYIYVLLVKCSFYNIMDQVSLNFLRVLSREGIEFKCIMYMHVHLP